MKTLQWVDLGHDAGAPVGCIKEGFVKRSRDVLKRPIKGGRWHQYLDDNGVYSRGREGVALFGKVYNVRTYYVLISHDPDAAVSTIKKSSATEEHPYPPKEYEVMYCIFAGAHLLYVRQN